MHQLLLPGFPDGTIKITETVSFLKKEKNITWFLGSDNYLTHPTNDHPGYCLAIATLIRNGHARSVDFERSELKIPHRTLMNWQKKLLEEGSLSFYTSRKTRGPKIMLKEIVEECEQLLSEGYSISSTARKVGINNSTLAKAIQSGKVNKNIQTQSSEPEEKASNKSERSQQDAEASMGVGCTRPIERVMASMGLTDGASVQFEKCSDVVLGGVLVGLPALCANGLFSGIKKYFQLPKGFYSVMNILMILAFMALGRIRRPEGLRHQPPGELGKIIGLDRVPEVRTLRKKIHYMAKHGHPEKWIHSLAKNWMQNDPEEAGYLYIDGHVRVYNGEKANLPKRFVSREKICLRGTTDYWVNDAIGRPFFVVSKAVTDGMENIIVKDIIPLSLKHVPNQPTARELKKDPLLHRFVMIFDREGATHKLLKSLWEHRVAAITYRKNVKDKWPEKIFKKKSVKNPGGEINTMLLAYKETKISSGKNSIPVLEVRKLSETGHQTAIITTARELKITTVAARMFSRWCQENYFAYMMNHYDIDGLVQYGTEEIPGTTKVINPAWREIEKKIKEAAFEKRKIEKKYYAIAIDPDDKKNILKKSELFELISNYRDDLHDLKLQRKKVVRKIEISKLPAEQRPTQLLPLSKLMTDGVKMIAYRAETALVQMLIPLLKKPEEARAIVREIFVSSVDIIPEENDTEKTLTIKVHRMTTSAHDKVVTSLLKELTKEKMTHPETGARMIYELV